MSASRFVAASLIGSVAHTGAPFEVGLAIALGFGSAVGLFGGGPVAGL